MNGKDIKLLRGQLRQVVKEELTEVLSVEVVKAIEDKIMKHVDAQLKALHVQVENSLKMMDKKVQGTMSHLIRNASGGIVATPSDKKE